MNPSEPLQACWSCGAPARVAVKVNGVPAEAGCSARCGVRSERIPIWNRRAEDSRVAAWVAVVDLLYALGCVPAATEHDETTRDLILRAIRELASRRPESEGELRSMVAACSRVNLREAEDAMAAVRCTCPPPFWIPAPPEWAMLFPPVYGRFGCQFTSPSCPVHGRGIALPTAAPEERVCRCVCGKIIDLADPRCEDAELCRACADAAIAEEKKEGLDA